MISDKQFASLDFKDWILVNGVEDDYLKKRMKYKDLKKWMKYKAGDYPDADEVLKINDDQGCILAKLGWYGSDVEPKEQYIDCIFSMETFFKSFMRFYVADHEFFRDGTSMYDGRLLDHCDELFCDEYKRRFCTKYDIKEKDMTKLFEQIDKFAKMTHTIGNYMPCPNNEYNRLKGFRFKDRLEILYMELQNSESPNYFFDDEEERHHLERWFNEKKEGLILEGILGNEKLLCFQFNNRMMAEDNIIPYTEYLECVNKIIVTRGKELAKKLK